MAAIEAGDAEVAEAITGDRLVGDLRLIQLSLEPDMGVHFSLNRGWRIK